MKEEVSILTIELGEWERKGRKLREVERDYSEMKKICSELE